jgi:hypothetical protein
MIRLKPLLERNGSAETVRETLLRRVPFLKSFQVTADPRDALRLSAQRIAYNRDVTFKLGDDLHVFPQFNVVSNVTYYPHVIDSNTFHYFTVKNEFAVMQPDNMDDLNFRVFRYAINSLQDKLSYSEELMIDTADSIPTQDMDRIINQMNKTFFAIEEYTTEQRINLF